MSTNVANDQQAIEALRAEMAELRSRIDSVAAREGTAATMGTSALNSVQRDTGWAGDCLEHLQATMAERGKSRGLGFWRCMIAKNEDGVGTNAREVIETTPPSLIEEKLIARLQPFLDPVVLRALHALLESFLEKGLLSMSRQEMARRAGVDETALDTALGPLHSRGDLSRKVTADGEDQYELPSAAPLWVLLDFA